MRSDAFEHTVVIKVEKPLQKCVWTLRRDTRRQFRRWKVAQIVGDYQACSSADRRGYHMPVVGIRQVQRPFQTWRRWNQRVTKGAGHGCDPLLGIDPEPPCETAAGLLEDQRTPPWPVEVTLGESEEQVAE